MFRKEIILLLAIIATVAFGQYRCDWSVLSNGSGNMISTSFKSLSTIGQTAAGSLTSTNVLAYIGFWYPGMTTGIMEDKGDEIIQTNQIVTKLYSAKPNPFISHTTIRYSIASETDVSLRIYDITGREMIRLVSSKQPTGIYTMQWNGNDARGRQLAAGVYFCQLNTNDYTKTNKILLTQ